MGFEKFGLRPERQYNQELSALNQEAIDLLSEATLEDRLVFKDLKGLEKKFFLRSN